MSASEFCVSGALTKMGSWTTRPIPNKRESNWNSSPSQKIFDWSRQFRLTGKAKVSKCQEMAQSERNSYLTSRREKQQQKKKTK